MNFKRAAIISLILVLGLCSHGTVHAIPYTYTIEGTINYIYERPGYNYIMNDQGWSVGDTIQYVIEIDLDRLGTIVKHNAPDGTQGVYAHYISGDALPLHPSVSFSDGQVTERNYMLTSGSVALQADFNQLRIDGGSYAEWNIGETFTWGYNYYYDFGYSSTTWTGYLRSNDLKVVAKESSSSTSVPDAPILMLLSTALIGLVVLSRKTAKS